MPSVIIGLLSLGIIILIHELGHYYFAKKFGIVVEEFAIGIGPKLISKEWKNTLWSIRALPLGGFCRMKSPNLEAFQDKNNIIPEDHGSFNGTSYFGKVLVLLGGPIANIILFILISLLLFGTSGKNYELQSYIEPIEAPANTILQAGDRITKINDIEILSYNQLATTATRLTGKVITLEYERDGSYKTIEVTLNNESPALGVIPFVLPVINTISAKSLAQKLGLQVGDIITEVKGITIVNALNISRIFLSGQKNTAVPFYVLRDGRKIKYETLLTKKNKNILQELGITYPTVLTYEWKSFNEFLAVKSKQLFSIFGGTLKFFVDVISFNTKNISQNTAGPIRLVSIVGNNTMELAQEYGFWYAFIQFLSITSLLSIAIASLNLLPIPMLDGGQLTFYTFFRLRRKKPTVKAYMRFNTVGIVILLGLFAFIMFFDIKSLL